MITCTDLSSLFVRDIFRLSQARHPISVLHQAKRCMVDYIGVTISGARNIEKGLTRMLDFIGYSKGESLIIGLKNRSSQVIAALLNGMSSHVLELDDGIRYGMIHLGSPIISSLIAIAEEKKVNGLDLLNGIVTGYETAIRISNAIQPGHYARGYHPTATCGAIGSAAGISAMLNFSETQMYNAIAAASISSGGSLKVIENGSLLKPLNSGKAAMLGLASAAAAYGGFSAPDDAFGGETGFFAMMTGTFNESILLNEEAREYWIESIYFKPYAACRHAHSAIEAVLKIKDIHNIRFQDISKIEITTYDSVLGKHDYYEVKDAYSAKMSIPYSVALAAVVGSANAEDYNNLDSLINDEIHRLSQKITIKGSAELSAQVPNKRSAIVVVKVKSGLIFEERIDYPLGEPENPMTDEQIVQKCYRLARDYFPDESSFSKMIACIWNIEENLPKFLLALQ